MSTHAERILLQHMFSEHMSREGDRFTRWLESRDAWEMSRWVINNPDSLVVTFQIKRKRLVL